MGLFSYGLYRSWSKDNDIATNLVTIQGLAKSSNLKETRWFDTLLSPAESNLCITIDVKDKNGTGIYCNSTSDFSANSLLKIDSYVKELQGKQVSISYDPVTKKFHCVDFPNLEKICSRVVLEYERGF